jgi:hydrogenase maturation factor
MKEKFETGKLNPALLKKLLRKCQGKKDKRVIVGPKIGEDATVIDFSDRYLVVKTDPITYTSQEIGYFAPIINANDIVCRGAKPRWFLATILLPEKKTDSKLVEKIFKDIDRACKKLNVSVVGGHTEITPGISHPIVVGTMIGEVEKGKLITSSQARVGDLILLLKPIAIEGTAIIAREREKELRKRGYKRDFIERAKNLIFDPGISIVKEALLASNFCINAMHDITEGGILGALWELAFASRCGMIVFEDKISILKECKILCQEFNLDPLKLIASGSFILTANEREALKIIKVFAKENIECSVIGEIQEKSFGLKIKRGNKILKFSYPKRDEITKLF